MKTIGAIYHHNSTKSSAAALISTLCAEGHTPNDCQPFARSNSGDDALPVGLPDYCLNVLCSNLDFHYQLLLVGNDGTRPPVVRNIVSVMLYMWEAMFESLLFEDRLEIWEARARVDLDEYVAVEPGGLRCCRAVGDID